MSIIIIEVFVQIREALTVNLSLKLDVEEIKKKLSNHSKNIELVFNYLDELIDKKDNEKPRKLIGYDQVKNNPYKIKPSASLLTNLCVLSCSAPSRHVVFMPPTDVAHYNCSKNRICKEQAVFL